MTATDQPTSARHHIGNSNTKFHGQVVSIVKLGGSLLMRHRTRVERAARAVDFQIHSIHPAIPVSLLLLRPKCLSTTVCACAGLARLRGLATLAPRGRGRCAGQGRGPQGRTRQKARWCALASGIVRDVGGGGRSRVRRRGSPHALCTIASCTTRVTFLKRGPCNADVNVNLNRRSTL